MWPKTPGISPPSAAPNRRSSYRWWTARRGRSWGPSTSRAKRRTPSLKPTAPLWSVARSPSPVFSRPRACTSRRRRLLGSTLLPPNPLGKRGRLSGAGLLPLAITQQESKEEDDVPTQRQRFGQGGARPPWLRRFLALRSVPLTAAFWVLATIAVFLIVGDGELPFGERPSLEGVLLTGQVINGWATLGIALILIGVTFLITRGRAVPDMAARAPEKTVALAETAALVGYGVLVQFGGLLLGRAVGDHAISLHMHGTLYGTENPLSPTEAVVWMLYNIIFYALLPYLFFRSRGYSSEQLNLRSSNRANDALLIVVILVLESAIEFSLVSSAIFGLDANQLLI